MKQDKKRAHILFINGLQAYYLKSYDKAEVFLQESLSLFSKGTARYNQAEKYLKKARQKKGTAA